MSNPVMNNNPYFKRNAVTPNMQYRSGGTATAQQPYLGQYQQSAEAKNMYGQSGYGYGQDGFAQYGYAAASPVPARVEEPMTYDDAMVKTAILLGASVVAGVLTAFLVPLNAILPVAILASIAAFVVGLMLAFRPMTGPGGALAYSVLEGACLGGLTMAINTFYPGVAFQAVLGTAIVVGVSVFLHVFKIVRTTSRGRRIALTAMIAYVIFGIVNLVLVSTGISGSLRRMSPGGFNIGLILGIIMIAVAAYMLIADLETAKMAVENRAPKQFAWTVGLGIVMTVLWIYLEVLRIATIIASSDR